MSTAAMTMIKKTITKVCGTLRFFMTKDLGAKILKIFLLLPKRFFIMRKTSFLFLVATLIGLVSCNKSEPQGGNTEPLILPTYEIGQYFRNDTLEGVVFFTTSGGAHGLMVGLDETELSWCINTYINEETGATNPNEGWCNTNILNSNYDLSHYPVIEWSYLRNTWHLVHYPHRNIKANQWYVPSSNELRYLLQNHEAVSATLSSRGCPTLEDKTYWSSTELGTRSAAYGLIQRDTLVIGEALKTETYHVRAIRNF